MIYDDLILIYDDFMSFHVISPHFTSFRVISGLRCLSRCLSGAAGKGPCDLRLRFGRHGARWRLEHRLKPPREDDRMRRGT